MKLLNLSGAGVKVWGKGSFSLDFAKHDGVISLMGNNGAGKTRLFELLGPAMLYRDLPTRDTKDLETVFHQGGYADLEIQQGKDHYTLHIERRTSDFLCNVEKNGKKLPESTGKVRAYDQIVESIVGPQSAFYASVYGAQGGIGGLGGLGDGDRKKILTYYLGLDRVATLHKVFNDELKEAKRAASDAVTARLDVEETEKLQAESSRAQKAYQEEIAKAKEVLANAQAKCLQLGDFEARRRERKAWETNEQRRIDAVASAKLAHNEVLARIADLKKSLEQKSSVKLPTEPKAARDTFQVKLRQLQQGLRSRTQLEAEKAGVGREAERAKSTSSLIDKVPCEAQGKYAACQLLSSALEARDTISVLKSRWETLTAELRALPTYEEQKQLEEQDQELRNLWRMYDEESRAAQDEIARRRRLEAQLEAAVEEEKRIKKALMDAESVKPMPKPPVSEDDRNAEELLLRRESAEYEVNRLKDLLSKEAGRYEARELILAKARKRLEESSKVMGQIEELELIVKGLGAGGLRALEMDVAGPELTDTANRILAKCLGGRFSCKFITCTENSSGGTKEVLDVLVYDSSEPDVPRLLGDISGGERVIVDEAIRASLAIFANQRLDRPFATLWRDELGSALDVENKMQYVAMLRQAMKEGAFSHVLFISHDPDVVMSADHTIVVGPNGPSFLKKANT